MNMIDWIHYKQFKKRVLVLDRDGFKF